MYDFDTVYSRAAMCSEKWLLAQKKGMCGDTVPFTVADMELRAAPEIIEAVQAVAATGMWGYTYGDDCFKQSVVNWFARRHNWQAEAGWMVNTPGIVPAIYVAVRAFTQPGDGVLVQPPVYTPFFNGIKNNGRMVVENPLKIENNAYKMDFDDLAVKLRQAKLMILCSPHNPVGRVWTRQELEQVAALCKENGVVLFSDEIHCDILPGGAGFTPAGTLGEGVLDNLVVGTSASKTFSLAGLGCSSLFIPNAGLRAKYKAQMGCDGIEFNTTFGVAATRAAYDKAGPWLDAFLEYLRGNIACLQEFLAAELPGVTVGEIQGTYLAWLDFTALGYGEKELMQRLHQQQVFLGSGEAYGSGGAGHLRMNLACPRVHVEGALGRMKKALQ